MKNTDYRQRFFSSYMATQWLPAENISMESYDLTCKVLEKHLAFHLPEDKSAAILDIACGTGHFLHFAQKRGYVNASGIDLGKDQLEVARKLGVRNVQEGNLFDFLSTRKGQYDMILASHIIEHLTKDEAVAALDLIHAALKPNGKVIILTPNSATPLGIWLSFSDFTHELVFTPQSLSQLLRVCGFPQPRAYGFGPVAYDVRSALRTLCWKVMKIGLKLSFLIERGTGRSIWASRPVFESVLMAVAGKNAS
jgi:2-polyprenyl-3-methyl-5-hydroxy-6-metoxy-1,4-benzoquinol methylase